MDHEPPTPPPPPPGERSGLSTLAWAGIGCGTLALVAIIGLAFFIGWGARQIGAGVKKIGGYAENLAEMANDPVALVEFIANQSPDIEIVSKDDAAETITVRNTKDGKEITLNYQDIRDGKLSIINDDGEFNFNLVQEDGTLTVETPDGKTVVGTNVELPDLPDWVPLYPGAKSQAASVTVSTAEKSAGTVVLTTPDAAADVEVWLRQQLETDGFTVTTTNTPAATVIQSKSTTSSKTVNASIVTGDAATTTSITFGE